MHARDIVDHMNVGKFLPLFTFQTAAGRLCACSAVLPLPARFVTWSVSATAHPSSVSQSHPVTSAGRSPWPFPDDTTFDVIPGMRIQSDEVRASLNGMPLDLEQGRDCTVRYE
jgi:hypothetical protein